MNQNNTTKTGGGGGPIGQHPRRTKCKRTRQNAQSKKNLGREGKNQITKLGSKKCPKDQKEKSTKGKYHLLVRISKATK
jgi:hypothetical protein